MKYYDVSWRHTSSSLRALALEQLQIDLPKLFSENDGIEDLSWEACKAKYQSAGQYVDDEIMVALVKYCHSTPWGVGTSP